MSRRATPLTTHYTQIKAGDLHRANGGYLVMYALHLVRQRETWDALKRALKAEEIEMRPPQSDGPVIANSLWPEPVPLRVKVILLGSAGQYYSLFENDEEFRDLFKVRADFSDTCPVTRPTSSPTPSSWPPAARKRSCAPSVAPPWPRSSSTARGWPSTSAS
jgi:predicted ATP-dependent protease